MDSKRHPDSKTNSRTIASNTNTITCGVCGTKQYFKSCLHNDFPDPLCIPNPEWHPCSDAFGKNYSRIEPLLSSPSLMNPLYANAAMLQAPPNVFHSHSSMGVRLMPSSTPCLSKEKQDAEKEPIHNSKSSMNQSIRKGKTRPGGRPKSRAGYESLEKVNETNIQPQLVPVPGEPNCCPIQLQQNCWQNYCRFVPYAYQPMPVPVAHYIPVYIPVGSSDVDVGHMANSSSQTETVVKDEGYKNESDDDFEEVAKKLVQGIDSDDETNLDEFVNRFDAGVENNLNVEGAIPIQNECDSNEENDKDEWSSNENYRDKSDNWARKNVESDERPLSGSSKSKKSDEDELVFKENLRDAEESTEKKMNSDFEEKTLIAPSTPLKMSLNEYDYDTGKNGDNGGSQSESVSESEGSRNSKTRSNDSRLNFKPDLEQDDVDRIMDTLEGIKSGKEDSQENLNLRKQDEYSEGNNDSDDEGKFQNNTDIILDTEKPYHEGNEEIFQIINVYKKVSNEDGKEDWLDTEDEILSYVRKDSYDNLPLKNQKESELVFEKRDAMSQFIDKNIQEEGDEDFLVMKKRPERKEDNHKKYKDSIFSPRASAKIKNVQDQGSNTQGEKSKNVTNKLIYTAIINRKEEKEKGDLSPFNSPRWRDESKRNGKRQDAKKRWMI